MTDWAEATTTLSNLRRSAFKHREMTSTLDWLKAIGLVPEGVNYLPGVRHVKLDMDPNAIPVGYLAATAHEWDAWGPSSPTDLVKALAKETRGDTSRDLISETLTALGRSMAEAQVA